MTLWTAAHQAPLYIGFSSKNTEGGCHALLQGGLPDPGVEPEFLGSPVLAGGFFTTGVTWEAPEVPWMQGGPTSPS